MFWITSVWMTRKGKPSHAKTPNRKIDLFSWRAWRLCVKFSFSRKVRTATFSASYIYRGALACAVIVPNELVYVGRTLPDIRTPAKYQGAEFISHSILGIIIGNKSFYVNAPNRRRSICASLILSHVRLRGLYR